MSRLRPECGNYPTGRRVLPSDTALYLIRDSVARRRSLISGRLHDGRGAHCAIGAFFADNPEAVIYNDLIDEVATVNDSVLAATPHERWKKVVMSWLRWKVRVLATAGQR